jgi:hypothetical protein
MVVLEVFIHKGCTSEQPALTLVRELEKEFPTWTIQIRQIGCQQAVALQHSVLPAFVVDGRVVAVGVPRKEWLVRRLRQWSPSGS